MILSLSEMTNTFTYARRAADSEQLAKIFLESRRHAYYWRGTADFKPQDFEVADRRRSDFSRAR